MTDLPDKYHVGVIDQIEILVDRIRHDGHTILNGLADRPVPGAKQKARSALLEILEKNGKLWSFIEGKKPLVLTTSDEKIL